MRYSTIFLIIWQGYSLGATM